ncbi:reticulon-like protein B17 [Iris pallida]|uniref:Reticulon-like protein B17 n=1 Tax=Iris pallida TaxID=29817 RepID=A0AAX6GXU9_IRIPA|nr:reticulon-like protein B17 [Iris pallida]
MMDSSTTTITTPLSHRSNPRMLLPNTTTTAHNIDHHPTETPNNSLTPPPSNPPGSYNINNNDNNAAAAAAAAAAIISSSSIHSPPPPHIVSLQDHLLLLSSSPPPPYRKPMSRPILLDEASLVLDVSQQSATPRRRGGGKSRASAAASPRNVRRARRRLEKDIINVKEEREESRDQHQMVVPNYGDQDVGGRGKRKQTRSKVSHKDKLWLVQPPPSLPLPSPSPSPSPSPKIAAAAEDDNSHQCMDSKWELIRELVMWKNVAKSTLWFGLGSMFFLSSCFSGNFSFSLISAASHLGILVLGLAFFYDSVPQRQGQKTRGANFQLTEEDILRTARLIMPMANAVLAKSQEVFSGEPLMTLKASGTYFNLHGKVWTPDNPMEASSNRFFLEFHHP